MKAIINKKIKLEELFENKGRCWEHTMDFLKQVKYKNDFDKYFEIIINLYENNVEINYNGELYCVDKFIFEIIEEPKEELEELKEIELIDNRKAYDTTNLNDGVTNAHKCGLCDVIQNAKINELIANQNKIVRELKANKKQ